MTRSHAEIDKANAHEDESGRFCVFVAGKPAPQGSIRAVVHKSTGRAVAIKDNNDTQKTWREDVRQALLNEAGRPSVFFANGVSVRLFFVMPRPVSTPKRRTPLAVKKPDIDKLARAVLDAITSAGVMRDDSQVVELNACKRIAEVGEAPGCVIYLSEPDWLLGGYGEPLEEKA